MTDDPGLDSDVPAAPSEDGTDSVGGRITCEGRFYVAGLFWQIVQDPGRGREEAVEAARSLNEPADVYCLRPGPAPQYGLGRLSSGHEPGAISAAALAAGAFSDGRSVLAAFAVPEGWWCFALRANHILPEGDRVVGTADEARAFVEDLRDAGWDVIAAPAELGVAGSEDVPLASVLGSGRGARLVHIDARGRGLRVAAMAGAVAAVLALVAWVFADEIMDLLDPPQPVSVRAAKPAARPAATKPSLPTISDLAETLESCHEGMARLTVAVPGWRLRSLKCSGGRVAGRWERTAGEFAWLRRALGKDRVSVRLLPDGTGATASVGLATMRAEATEPSEATQQIRIRFVEIFQAAGAEIRLVVGRAPLPGEPPQYPKVGFEFTSRFPPSQWQEVLARFPALEIGEVIGNLEKGFWTIKGTVHALR